jgi:hypothetical protein
MQYYSMETIETLTKVNITEKKWQNNADLLIAEF